MRATKILLYWRLGRIDGFLVRWRRFVVISAGDGVAGDLVAVVVEHVSIAVAAIVAIVADSAIIVGVSAARCGSWRRRRRGWRPAVCDGCAVHCRCAGASAFSVQQFVL